MSLGSLGSLNVLLSADTAQFSSAMSKAAYQAERDLQKISRSAKINSAVIATALIAAATAFTVKMKSIIDSADDIGKMAQSLGVTSEQLSKLKYAAELSGISIEELRTSFSRMNKNVYDNATAFAALGISLKDSSGNLRNGGEIILDVADKFSRMKDGVGKAAAAQEIFGKSGALLIPLLNQGRDGIKALGDEAERMGIVIDTKTAKAAEVFNDNMQRLSKNVDGAFLSIGSDLIPVLASLSESFKSSSDQTESFTTAGKSLALVLVSLVNTGKVLYTTLTSLIDGFGAVGAQISFVMLGQFKEAKTVSDLYSKDMEQRWSKLASDLGKNWDLLGDKAQDSDKKTSGAIKQQLSDLEEFNKNMEAGIKLKESLRTAQEKYNDEMEYYNILLQGGAIDQETFERAAKKSLDSLHEQTKTTNKLGEAAKDLGFSFQSAFEDAILEGKKFNEVVVALGKDIERILLRKMITEPLANAIAGGISGFFNTPTRGVSVTSSPYTDAVVTASRKGNAFVSGRIVPFASGGVIGGPMMFPMAGGKTGLAGEAGKEAILPLTRTSSGDLGVKATASRTVVNVYAPPGSEVKQDSQQDGGLETISIYIDEAVAGNIGKPGSKTHRSLKNTFGLGQTLTKR